MRLYGAIEKVVPLEDGTVRVHGIASSEAVDDQSEIVRGDAMRAALPGYMVFPAVRTMHQLDAAGTTLEAEVGDDNVTRIVAHVVDPVAVLKVKNNVFRGFSIGGRVTERDPRNSKCITGLVLSEISLVDRPANAEAVFDCWKASNMPDIQQATIAPFNAPIQIWDCGVADHKHLAKAAATRCLAERASTDVGDADNSGEPVVDDAEKAGTEVAPPTEAEIEKQASEGAATAQAIIDAALQAIESGEAALAKSEPEEKCAKCGWRTEAGGVQHHDETCPEHALNKAGDAIAKDNGDGGDMGEAAKDGDMEMADKADDGGKFADPGYQEDKKPRYKLNNEKQVRAAWSYIHMPKNAKFYSADQLSSIKSKIRAAGKKYNIDFSEKTAIAVLTKSLWDIGEVAMLIAGLRTMCERLELERAMEGDDSALPESCEAVCASACALLMAMCAEETQEVLDDTEIDEPVGPAMNEMMMSAIAQSLTKAIPDTAKVEQLMETLGKVGARHRQEIQAQLDLAAHAIDRAMDVGDLKRAEMISAGDAHKAVLDGGAVAWGPAIEGREMLTDGNPSGDPGPTEHATVDTGSNAAISVPNPTGAVPASPWPKVAKTVDPAELARIEAMIKANKGGKALLSAAHDLICSATEGATCKEDAAKPGHMSARDMTAMHKAHSHLMAVDGVACAANPLPGGAPSPAGEAEGPGTVVSTAKVADPAPAAPSAAADAALAKAGIANSDLTKALMDERAEKAELVRTIGAIVPMLDRLTKRVDQIAETPLPARAIANTAAIGLTKAQDGGSLGGGPAGARPSFDQVLKSMPPEVLAAYYAQPAEQQSMLMIKHSLGQPIAYDPVKRVLVAA